MEDDPNNFFKIEMTTSKRNGRQLGEKKMKTTSTTTRMEDDLNKNLKMEDDLKNKIKMEDDLKHNLTLIGCDIIVN